MGVKYPIIIIPQERQFYNQACVRGLADEVQPSFLQTKS